MPSQEELVLSLVQGEGGKEWASRRTGWESGASEPVCDWDGIECDNDDKKTVVSISLPSSDLSTTIPSQLGQLKSLQTLNLRENIVWGFIPTAVAALTELEIFDVAQNRLTGSIPRFSSTVLRKFDASRNMLTGSLPSDVGASHQLMTLYDAMYNSLTGTIPKSFKEMRNLVTLSLSENGFSGTIPPNLGDLRQLKYLYLDNNNLVGVIPPNVARPDDPSAKGSSMLSEVWFHENMLSGTIPAALADLDKLVNLYIDGNKFTGTIPNALCRPTLNADFFEGVPDDTDRNYCDSVACPANTAAFEGVFPCTKCESSYDNPYLGRTGECINLNQRIILDKFYESTSQSGPWKGSSNWDDEDTFLCDFSGVTCDSNSNVIRIELKGRGLKGTIPEEIGFLSFLEVLDLSDNHLSGFLPSDLRWAPLRHLDVSGNHIKGIVPPMLCLKGGVNGNGDNGDYNCERIACPAATFSPTGRESSSGEMCMPCMDNNANMLGMKTCEALAIAKPFDARGSDSGISVSGLVGLTVSVVVFFIAATFFVALRMNKRRRLRGEEVPQEEMMDDKHVGIQRNPAAVSSLPYADEEDYEQVGHRRGRTNLPGSSYRTHVNMPPPDDPLYAGTFPDEEEYDSVASGGSRSNGSSGDDADRSPLGDNNSKNGSWEYPDKIGVRDSGRESSKEVWLDVPKIE